MPDVLLTAKELREGIERLLQLQCTHAMAEDLIRALDSSSYLARDGRLTFADFERLFMTGRDPSARTLMRAAHHRPAAAAPSPALEAHRRKAEITAGRARRRADRALRLRIARTRDAFESTWLTRRLAAEYEASLAAHAASMAPGQGLEVALSPARNPHVPSIVRVELQLTNRLVPSVSPLLALSSADLQRTGGGLGGVLSGAELQLALRCCGMELQAGETLRLLSCMGEGAGTLPPREVDWRELLARLASEAGAPKDPLRPADAARLARTVDDLHRVGGGAGV